MVELRREEECGMSGILHSILFLHGSQHSALLVYLVLAVPDFKMVGQIVFESMNLLLTLFSYYEIVYATDICIYGRTDQIVYSQA